MAGMEPLPYGKLKNIETGKRKNRKDQPHPGRKERRLVIEINKDIEKYQESVAMGFSAKQLVYSILALVSGCLIVFLLYEKIGLTFSCYVAVPIVAPIALCGFYSYNGMGFMEVFTRYMRSIFRNKALVFKSSGYREMTAQIRAKEEAEKRAAVKREKEEHSRSRKEKIKSRVKHLIKRRT